MESATFIHVANLNKQTDIPATGTLSLTLHQDEHVKVVLFAFAQGQELSEHTASIPAQMQQLSGRSRWRLAGEEIIAEPGTWVHMPAHMPHAIVAETPAVMLLTMLRSAKEAGSQA